MDSWITGGRACQGRAVAIYPVKDRFITEKNLHTRREGIISELIDKGQAFTFTPDVSYDRRGRYYNAVVRKGRAPPRNGIPDREVLDR
jgi:hypothetical protein